MKDYKDLSRYYYGVATIDHKGKTVTTSVGTSYDDVVSNIRGLYSNRKGSIPVAHANRPDLTSDIFYSSPKYWWLLMQYNNITDPFEEFNSGDDILIPNI